MFRIVFSFAFLAFVVAVSPNVNSAETDAAKCEKSEGCEKSQCAAKACTGESCSKSTAEGQCCASEGKLCAGEGKLCAGEGKLCASEGKVCASEGKLCAGEGKLCASEGKVCASNQCAGEAGDCCANKLFAKDECEVQSLIGSLPQLMHLNAVLNPETGATCEIVTNTACAKGACAERCCEDNAAAGCCADADLVVDKTSCSGCPGAELTFTDGSKTAAACRCGDSCSCCSVAEQALHRQIAAFHGRLAKETTKNALLTAQLKHAEALAKAYVQFAKQMLEKESQVAHLHAELRLTEMKAEAKQEIAEAVFESERAKASLELVSEQRGQLKRKLAENESDYARALAESKSANNSLVKRVADLESQLNALSTRIARQPAGAKAGLAR